MKRALIALAAFALASAAWAQQETPPTAKPQQEAAKPRHETAPGEQEQPKPATVARKSRRGEDARHCLERASNTEIIKCAEEYL